MPCWIMLSCRLLDAAKNSDRHSVVESIHKEGSIFKAAQPAYTRRQNPIAMTNRSKIGICLNL